MRSGVQCADAKWEPLTDSESVVTKIVARDCGRLVGESVLSSTPVADSDVPHYRPVRRIVDIGLLPNRGATCVPSTLQARFGGSRRSRAGRCLVGYFGNFDLLVHSGKIGSGDALKGLGKFVWTSEVGPLSQNATHDVPALQCLNIVGREGLDRRYGFQNVADHLVLLRIQLPLISDDMHSHEANHRVSFLGRNFGVEGEGLDLFWFVGQVDGLEAHLLGFCHRIDNSDPSKSGVGFLGLAAVDKVSIQKLTVGQ